MLFKSILAEAAVSIDDPMVISQQCLTGREVREGWLDGKKTAWNGSEEALGSSAKLSADTI